MYLGGNGGGGFQLICIFQKGTLNFNYERRRIIIALYLSSRKQVRILTTGARKKERKTLEESSSRSLTNVMSMSQALFAFSLSVLKGPWGKRIKIKLKTWLCIVA